MSRYSLNKLTWMERDTLLLPYWTVCFTQEQFDAAIKHAKLMEPGAESIIPYIDPGAGATTHTFTNREGECVVLVALPLERIGTPEWISLAAHEARHVIEGVYQQNRCLGRDEELDAFLIQVALQRILVVAEKVVKKQRSKTNARSKSKKTRK